MRYRKTAAVTSGALIVLGSLAASAATSVKPYAIGLNGNYKVTPVLSVADSVSGSSGLYQMVGFPDGLGAASSGKNQTTLFMNHEFSTDKESEPFIGGPLNRGAFVSRYTLDKKGDVVAGDRAYDWVFAENEFVGPAPDTTNDTPAFGRFCSGSMAGAAEGLDRDIYFTGEESDGAVTFSGQGGETVAIFDNEIHTLPAMGRFSKENTLIMPGTGDLTVAMTMEDGPSGPESQLYMYVGEKVPEASSVLTRNGLDNGSLFAFRSSDPSMNSETTFQEGSIEGTWVEIPGAAEMTDEELEAASDAAGAMGFVRIEDGAFSKTDGSTFFFDTTGGSASAGNELGRLYSLSVDPTDPAGSTSELEVLYNADQVVASGGDTALSPDNLDTSKQYLMVQEDGTTQSRAVMADKGRDGSIWRFRITDGGTSVDPNGERVVELNPAGRDGTAVGPGVWETSGIIDGTSFFGPNTWIFDVQAHAPTTAPAPNTIEDGQLLILRP